MSELTQLPAWKNLLGHYQEIEELHLRDLFAEDPKRFDKFSLLLDDILFDFSKHRITDTTLKLLIHLARETGLEEKIDKMFATCALNPVLPALAEPSRFFL